MASNKIRVTDLEFDDIKTNLKNYLSAQSEFVDYDFTGSGMDVLLDVLAYNTHYMGYYANMMANEMFLDTAALRESVVSHAKHLNYIPSSVTAPTAYLNMTFTPSGSPTSITIAKNTKFRTVVDGEVFNYITTAAVNITPVNNIYAVALLPIKEGSLLSKNYTVNIADETQRFLIPNNNVDTSTITVTVQNSVSDTTVATYVDGNSLDITTITSTQKVYFLQEVEDRRYEIFFGDGAIGKQLADGNIVTIEYLVTNGITSNKASNFTAVSTVADLSSSNFTLATAIVASGGSAIESLTSIRNTAPKLYQAQKRAVTKEDYKSILLAERADIESITVYGGEEASPAVYGKVFVAVKPIGNNTFGASTKDAIKSTILKRTNVVTIQPEIVDPIFYYLIVDTTVNYDPVTLLISQDQLKTLITGNINSYFNTNLKKFDQKFRYSVLTKDIDNTDTAIRNSKTAIKYQLRITPAVLETAASYTLEFNNPLTKGSLTSTAFTASDGNIYCLVDDSAGVIKLARATIDATTGVATVSTPNVFMTLPSGATNQGTIDYDTGKIVLGDFSPYTIPDGTGSIRVTLTPGINNQDITPLREQILTTDLTDSTAVNVTMVAETII